MSKTLDESKYPHIYAFAYILLHGEIPVGSGLPLCGYTEEGLRRMESRLASMLFKDIVTYANQEPGIPVRPDMASLHNYMLECGIVLEDEPKVGGRA